MMVLAALLAASFTVSAGSNSNNSDTINNYGDTTADQKRAFLKSYKPLANVSAIKNDRIVVLDYVDLVESPRNPAAISSLAEDLRTFAQ